jgi:hypothetical protein
LSAGVLDDDEDEDFDEKAMLAEAEDASSC